MIEKDPAQPNGPPATSLVEIGPRFVLTPIRIFEGAFGGATVFSNPGVFSHFACCCKVLICFPLRDRICYSICCSDGCTPRRGDEVSRAEGGRARKDRATRGQTARRGRTGCYKSICVVTISSVSARGSLKMYCCCTRMMLAHYRWLCEVSAWLFLERKSLSESNLHQH